MSPMQVLQRLFADWLYGRVPCRVPAAGSGKTYTMSGPEDVVSDESYNGHEHDGIVSRAVQYLFKQVGSKVAVTCS